MQTRGNSIVLGVEPFAHFIVAPDGLRLIKLAGVRPLANASDVRDQPGLKERAKSLRSKAGLDLHGVLLPFVKQEEGRVIHAIDALPRAIDRLTFGYGLERQ